MVTDFLLQMLAGIIQGVLSLIPVWGIDTSAATALDSGAVTAASLDGWLPETFIFICLGVMIAARLWFFVAGALQWLYHLIPFNGG